ncbi:hypothetical protein EDB69_1257 [Vibrio crassostreae]|nr:hypothetical protein EDB64_0438 [Vibrio crassostreae]ROP13468.1 hypothetical protein EDB63_0462 [Vibrio crassostreae]ROQ87543.1 hypothetical protein EDB72_1091 [Vibrio crassostreae]ROR05817.1 hypothetical protein EDB36_12229 [Vibrio crassostreae]ROR20680.1 hypothetical protein EDB67_11468 [Vibrio crassostreae]
MQTNVNARIFLSLDSAFPFLLVVILSLPTDSSNNLLVTKQSPIVIEIINI